MRDRSPERFLVLAAIMASLAAATTGKDPPASPAVKVYEARRRFAGNARAQQALAADLRWCRGDRSASPCPPSEPWQDPIGPTPQVRQMPQSLRLI